MSWSYTSPSASPKDEVRFLVGDTDAADQQLQDGEIDYNVTLVSGNAPPASGNFLAAAYCADAIRAKYARRVTQSIGDLRNTLSDLVKHYAEMATDLRRRATLASVPIYVGGQSISEKQGVDSDTDRVQPAIKIDGMSWSNTRFDPLVDR